MLLASRPLQPAWFSVRLLAWLGARRAPSAAAAVTWRNLHGFRAVLDADAAERMRAGRDRRRRCRGRARDDRAAALLVRPARQPRRRGAARRRDRRVGRGAALAARAGRSAGAGGAPPRPRPSAPSTPPPRVRHAALDGASLGFIRQRVAAGQLPNFGRLLDRGAVDRSGDAQADAGRAGVGRGGHRQVPAEERRAIERDRIACAATTPTRSTCCRTTASRTRCVDQGFIRAEPLTSRVAARAAALGHPRRLRRSRPASSTGR